MPLDSSAPRRIYIRRTSLLTALAVALPLTGALAWRTFGPTTRDGVAAAQRAFYGGDVANAELLLDVVFAAEPHQAEALHLKGEVLLSQGRHREALNYFQRVPDANAESSYLARCREASLLESLGRWREAESALLKAMWLHSNCEAAVSQLCTLYRRAGRWQAEREALAMLGRFRTWTAVELGRYLAAGSYVHDEAAFQRLKEVIRGDSHDSASRVTLAEIERRRGNFSAGLELLRNTRARGAIAQELEVERATALLAVEKLRSAADSLLQAAAGPQRYSGVFWCAAATYFRKNNELDDARRSLQLALRQASLPLLERARAETELADLLTLQGAARDAAVHRGRAEANRQLLKWADDVNASPRALAKSDFDGLTATLMKASAGWELFSLREFLQKSGALTPQQTAVLNDFRWSTAEIETKRREVDVAAKQLTAALSARR